MTNGIRIAIVLVFLAASQLVRGLELTPEEAAFIEQNPTITVGGEMDWPPMDFVEDDVYQGVAKDYLDEIEAISGLDFNIVTGYTWSELVELLDTRQVDMVPMMYWTDQRGVNYNMTNPYITVRHYAFTKGKRPEINNLDAMAGMTIAVPAGYAYIEFLANEHPDIKVLEVPTVLDAIDAVVIGEADVVIENTASVGYYAVKQNIIGLEPAFSIKFEVNNVHMAVRRDWPILRNILQKSLKEIPKHRTSEIMAKWTGSEATARTFQTAQVKFSKAEQDYLQRQKNLTACVQSSLMPFESMQDYNHTGMMSNYLAIVADTMNKPLAYTPVDNWGTTKAALSSGACDLATIHVDSGHQYHDLNSTQAFLSEDYALVTDYETPFLSSISELSDVEIAVVEGYADVNHLRDKYPNLIFSVLPNRELAYAMVKSGKIFGALDFVLVASHEINQNHHDTLKISAVGVTDPASIGFVIRNQNPLLVSAISKVIDGIPDSQHRSIRDKWVAVKVEEKVNYELLIQVLLGVACLLGFILWHLWDAKRHKSEIQEKNAALESINQELEDQRRDAIHRSQHDQLTGLANRAKMQLDLEQNAKLCDRLSSQMALMFLDLDRFKFVNDSFGHDIGDELLIAVAGRLQSILRDTDHLSRIGGDEFIVMLQHIDDEYSPSTVSQRIIESLTTPFQIGGHTLNIGTSIGVSIYPEDTRDLDELVKYADGAMYTAKEGGRNTFRYHMDELSAQAAERIAIEHALKQAIEKNHFQLALQPIVNLTTGKIVKAEALLRWTNPNFNHVGPDIFIPIAEECGLITRIGEWVLETACDSLLAIANSSCSVDTIAVNVSCVEFKSAGLIKRFERIIQAKGLEPRQIEIEITEGHMLDNNVQTAAELAQLRDNGHTICVDDFGTGYSSLSYMKQLPLNVVKIDRMFIQNIPHDASDMKISQAIISLAHALGYKVVAEGIESEEQLNFLVSQGCDYAQGYYFAKPLFLDDFIATAMEINEESSVVQFTRASGQSLRKF